MRGFRYRYRQAGIRKCRFFDESIQMMSESKKLMNSKEAAGYLCICPRKLWELSKSGRIQTVRIDRSVRYDIADLNSFIDQQKYFQEK